MQELISFIVKSIVDHPDHVEVEQLIGEDEQSITLRLTVHPDDMGNIIGKEGNIARAIRSLAKAMAIKNKQKVFIDIVDSGTAKD